ncbi:ubiquitin-conjugating enzyme E2 T isoform X1 [Cuculus canorus]|uniref:ubiquitin-conjugating enzyme E2 T isoform X1 n=1 Tax=Cuculus canorus TaxID=55661 RepID=UPI0023AB5344|nr:ubiquitin-conjugating enzyme E2 T isoform X1 [Cuculus canorus]
MQRSSRLKRELSLLATEPPPGIICWQHENQLDELRAQITGGAGTPYEKGIFNLEIVIPERYPFEPPKIRFLTPIYHPNIDAAGRICLDVLKSPPKGAWTPCLNIVTLLTSIQLLMAEPNPDDPLMAEISSEYKYNKELFLLHAREWSEKYASQQKRVGTTLYFPSREQPPLCEQPVLSQFAFHHHFGQHLWQLLPFLPFYVLWMGV